jgi:adenosylcobinamide-phosphate synthase
MLEGWPADIVALILGFLLDQLLGDPPNWAHPVRWIGRLAQLLEAILRKHFPDRFAGLLLLLFVVVFVGCGTAVVLALAGEWSSWARLVVATVLIYFGLAARSLARETAWVLEACQSEDWDEARGRLSRIVGRDTAKLPPDQIYRACIETVAENTSDGVVAPLFYAALAGPIGLWIYKAINTLDSMVGYRNQRYREFGWASARADDIVNFIPARLTWLLLALAALLCRRDGGMALRIGWRDGHKHPSPNAGWPEAAMAGALGVQLGGSSSYQGKVSQKPILGEVLVPVDNAQVLQALRLLAVASWLALFLALLVIWMVGWISQSWSFPEVAGLSICYDVRLWLPLEQSAMFNTELNGLKVYAAK